MEKIDSNAKLQQLKRQHKNAKLLNLSVYRGSAPVFEDVLVTQESQILVGRQEIRNEEREQKGKLKLKQVVEEDSTDASSFDSEGPIDIEHDPYFMGGYRPNANEGRGLTLEEFEQEETNDDETDSSGLDDEVLPEVLHHYDGETNVEDLFELDEEDQVVQEGEHITEPVVKRRKLPLGRGPTSRSHSSAIQIYEPNFKPSSDEEEKGFLKESDDDGFEPASFVPPKGRKSRAKKLPPRKWYDENREEPHNQLCLKMCFRDQHQVRDALLSLHISQSRSFQYHRNSDKRIIVECITKNICKFFMVAAVIKGEKTFAIKKMRLQHTCPTTTYKSRVTAKWLAKTYEPLFRSDLNTSIQTMIDNCQEKYGVEVPKAMAYRAKNQVIENILGEHKKQYTRIRDYARIVMDTNPGSRVIVTTVTPTPTAKIPHPGPRFHAMFFCLNGAREGFLQGCRPFIGVDGCFVKLCTGAQILAATRRDGNNNIYPLAFAIVGQEDTQSWCWFLHQLKICLGGETGQFGPYTIMSDRQKGLLNAVNQVFPNSHQRFCLRHLYANFHNVGFRGEDLKKYMDNVSYAYNDHKFELAMDHMKKESEKAWKCQPCSW